MIIALINAIIVELWLIVGLIQVLWLLEAIPKTLMDKVL